MSTTSQKVLKILKNAGGEYVSGEKIAQTLGVTRCSVWKAVLQLKKEGNMIYSVTNKGYCLSFSPELIEAESIKANLPREFDGVDIRVIDKTESTNSVLRSLADAGAPSGTVVIAREQTAGRGRQGKSFVSERDCGVYMSMLVRPELPAEDIAFVTTLTGVAVCKAINSSTELSPKIKWTNDIVANGKKVGGILTELTMNMETGKPDYCVVGVGVNCVTPLGGYDREIRNIAGSIGELSGSEPDPNRVAAAIIEHFYTAYFGSEPIAFGENDITNWQRGYIIDEARDLSAVLGQEIEVVAGERIFRGTAIDISGEGSLIVSCEGEFKEFRFGEVHVVL